MAAITKTIKKLSRMGNGAGVLLNREISKLQWSPGDFVSVEVFEDGKIVIKKVNY